MDKIISIKEKYKSNETEINSITELIKIGAIEDNENSAKVLLKLYEEQIMLLQKMAQINGWSLNS